MKKGLPNDMTELLYVKYKKKQFAGKWVSLTHMRHIAYIVVLKMSIRAWRELVFIDVLELKCI